MDTVKLWKKMEKGVSAAAGLCEGILMFYLLRHSIVFLSLCFPLLPIPVSRTSSVHALPPFLPFLSSLSDSIIDLEQRGRQHTASRSPTLYLLVLIEEDTREQHSHQPHEDGCCWSGRLVTEDVASLARNRRRGKKEFRSADWLDDRDRVDLASREKERVLSC